jgi:tight adherence protein B
MEYLVYVLVFFLLIGALMLGFGIKEARESRENNPVAKLQRLRELRGSLMSMGLDDELESELSRKFARDQEALAAAAKGQKKRGPVLTSLDGFTSKVAVLHSLDVQLEQIPALACLPIPWLYVKATKQRYYRRFDEQLSDVLRLMSNSLRAGFSFLQAVEMVAREAPFPVSTEFSTVTREIALGVPISQALDNLAARIQSADLDLMVTAVNIQRETGGALAEILDIIAEVIEQRMTIRGEIRTLTAQGRITGTVLGMLPIGLGLLIHLASRASAPNDPSFVQPLIDDTRGHLMVGMALLMQAVGIAWITKIVSIKV